MMSPGWDLSPGRVHKEQSPAPGRLGKKTRRDGRGGEQEGTSLQEFSVPAGESTAADTQLVSITEELGESETRQLDLQCLLSLITFFSFRDHMFA